jgi:hypothetical protein
MKSESPIIVSLERGFDARDEKAINSLLAKWLIYDVKINRRHKKTDIALFHSVGAVPELVKELEQLYPNEHLKGM